MNLSIKIVFFMESKRSGYSDNLINVQINIKSIAKTIIDMSFLTAPPGANYLIGIFFDSDGDREGMKTGFVNPG